MIRKILTLTVCLAAIAGVTRAQELGIGLDAGLQGMHYSLGNGETKLLPGASLEVNYTFPVYKGFGLLTGIGAGLYRTQATLNNSLAFAYDEVDDQGSAFLYNERFTGYKETVRTITAIIPLLLQYHTDVAAAQWYIDGGGKLFLPVNTSIKVTAQQMNLSGYYPNYDLVIADLPQHGFGTVNGWESSTTTQLKVSAALSAGTGFSFGISPGARLYAGVYLDYGLTGLRSKSTNDSMPMVTYSPTGIDKIKANSVLNMPNAGEPKMLAFGVQLRLTWGAKPTKHPAHPEKKPDVVFTVVTKGAPISYSELMALQRPIVFGIAGVTEIPETQTQLLDDVVITMQQHPDLRIFIVGHACNDTHLAEDAKIGDARARAVARYLERKGIDRHRMDISSAKESEPSTSSDPAANFRSRKVVISPE